MSHAIVNITMSLDGFVTAPNDGPGQAPPSRASSYPRVALRDPHRLPHQEVKGVTSEDDSQGMGKERSAWPS
jgi:hypothetical protein